MRGVTAGMAKSGSTGRGLVGEDGLDLLGGAPTLRVEHEPLARAALSALGDEEVRALHERAARRWRLSRTASVL